MPVPPVPHGYGNHHFPVRFSSGPSFATRRRRAWPWVLAIGALVLATFIAGGAHVQANSQYDSAVTALEASTTHAVSSSSRVKTAQSDSETVLANAQALVDIDAPDLISGAQREVLEKAIADLVTANEAAIASLADPPALPHNRPFWAWDLRNGADTINDRAKELDALVTKRDTSTKVLQTAKLELIDAAIETVEAAVTSASSIETKYIHASNATFIALHDANQATSAASTVFDSSTVTAVEQLATATAQYKSSDSSRTTQRKKMRLYDVRLKVEEYARSIAGGVRLQFEWAPIVNNFGDNGSAGGTATWNSAYGGHSLITLSDSVADYWPEERMKALVAHEVGHSIASKCYDKFDWESTDANEQWATAWAMSWGYEADLAGAWLYGVPSAALQNAAATCR